MKDYFSILGVSPTSTSEEIKKAYRSLAMKHHPDRGGDQAQFQEIQEAYDVLSTPERRQQWEHERQWGQNRGNHFNFNFGGPMNIDEIFRQFHGGGDPFGNFRRPQRNRHLHTIIQLDLASTLEPQTKYISLQNVNGHREMLTVEIPRGINNQVEMRFAGHGDKSFPEIPPGDLFINFEIVPHPDFEVAGLDLYRRYKLNCLEAIVGTSISVVGLDQKQFSLNVPAGTQHGTKFRIPQQGLYQLNSSDRGNLMIIVELEVPTGLDVSAIAAINHIIKNSDR